MNILLLSPARSARGREFWDFRFASFLRGHQVRCNPFLALPTVAALLPQEASVRIVDENIEPVPFDEPFDLVGVTTNTCLSTRAYGIADAFRLRGVPVVLGGIHPSLMPSEAATHADAVVVGEAEPVMSRLLDDLRANALQPIYRSDSPCPPADFPAPRWDLVALEHYSTPLVQTSRGCPHDCEFCSVKSVFGRKYRWRCEEDALREITALRALGRRTFFWADDNLAAHRPRLMRLLEQLTDLDMTFFCQVAVDVADDPEMLMALRKAGCKRVIIGFESLSQDNLRQMNKGATYRSDRYAGQVARIQDQGLEVMGSFIFGYDADGPDVFDRTRDFILDSGMSIAVLNVLTPYPGTDLFARLSREGRILTRDWSRFDNTQACFRPRRMTPEDLEQGVRQVQRDVFSYDAIFQRLQSLWGRWNRGGVFDRDRIAPILINLEAHAVAYGGPGLPAGPPATAPGF